MSSEQQTQQADDPSGDGWRWVRQGEALRHGDVEHIDGDWHPTIEAGYTCPRNHSYRRRIEPQQPSDSEPETMEMRLAKMTQWNLELEALVNEAERSGQQVNAELQQLREQVATLTQERDRLQSWLQQHHTTGQQSAIKKLERWLRPVLQVVSDHPDHSSILAVSVMEFLPQIASRLIEE